MFLERIRKMNEKKKKNLRISMYIACIVLLSLSVVMVIVFGKSKPKAEVSKNPVVIATTFSAYDWARNVLKDTNGIELLYLVDSSADMHSYTPSASDIVKYKNASLVIAIGGESEEWIEDVGLDESKVLKLISCVEVLQEDGEDGEVDEHIWLSLKNAEVCTGVIADRFSILDKENAETYKENAKQYRESLALLEKRYEDAVGKSEAKVLLFADRFPFAYLVNDYGISHYAAFNGCSAETEASFETVAFLAGKVRELGLPAVCTVGNPDIAKSVVRDSKMDGVEIVEFDALQSVTMTQARDASYLQVMENNLAALNRALGVE